MHLFSASSLICSALMVLVKIGNLKLQCKKNNNFNLLVGDHNEKTAAAAKQKK